MTTRARRRALVALVAALATCALALGASSSSRPHAMYARGDAYGTCDGSSESVIVVWHGMGDSGDALDGLARAVTRSLVPARACVRSLMFAATSSGDRWAGYVGDVGEQVDAACELLRMDDAVRGAGGFHALGLSQGGQFVRGVVQRCGRELGAKSLVTLGGQHAGVDALPGCGSEPPSATCRAMNEAASAASANALVRRRVVQAQYFRDTSTHATYQRYLETNAYLPEINNEGQANANAEYRDAIASLERFVMFMFENDDMVNPPESSWFGSRVVGGLNRSQIVPYDRNSAIYQNLGLDALDADGRLELRIVPGARHMQFDVDWLTREVVRKYFMY